MADVIVYNQQERNRLMPQSIQDKLLMAKQLAESGLMPAGLKTPQQIFVSLQWGHELGLSPMVAVNNISVINGKPTLGADLMHALARANPEYGGCEWKSMTAEKAEVRVKRIFKDRSETFIGYYDIAMAHTAGLTGKDNWKKFPQRMLKHRALSYALRDAFPDVLAGIYTPEEMTGGGMRNVTPAPEPEQETASAAGSEKPLPPAPGEKLIEMRRQLLNEIGNILSRMNPDELPYFSDEEKASEREFSKNTGPYEQGICLLNERKAALEAELEKRVQAFKPMPWGDDLQMETAHQDAAAEGETYPIDSERVRLGKESSLDFSRKPEVPEPEAALA